MGRPRSNRKCSVEGCDSKHYGKGFCCKHYQRLLHHGSTERIGWHSHRERVKAKWELPDDLKEAYGVKAPYLGG